MITNVENSGVYVIRNTKNNKIYIGSSSNLEKRWERHLKTLNNNSHHNISLQKDWFLFEKTDFVIEVLEFVKDRSSLYKREQHYLDSLKPFGEKGYNIGINSFGGDNLTKNPNREEIIKKITNSLKIRWSSKKGDELKMKFSKEFKGEGNPNWKGGKVYTCECGTKINMYAKTCAKCQKRNGDKNPFFGKTHSNENKQKASERMKGVYLGNQNIEILIDEVEYSSCGEASRKLNIIAGTIRHRVYSQNPKFNNYKLKNEK